MPSTIIPIFRAYDSRRTNRFQRLCGTALFHPTTPLEHQEEGLNANRSRFYGNGGILLSIQWTRALMRCRFCHMANPIPRIFGVCNSSIYRPLGRNLDILFLPAISFERPSMPQRRKSFLFRCAYIFLFTVLLWDN